MNYQELSIQDKMHLKSELLKECAFKGDLIPYDGVLKFSYCIAYNDAFIMHPNFSGPEDNYIKTNSFLYLVLNMGIII